MSKYSLKCGVKFVDSTIECFIVRQGKHNSRVVPCGALTKENQRVFDNSRILNITPVDGSVLSEEKEVIDGKKFAKVAELGGELVYVVREGATTTARVCEMADVKNRRSWKVLLTDLNDAEGNSTIHPADAAEGTNEVPAGWNV